MKLFAIIYLLISSFFFQQDTIHKTGKATYYAKKFEGRRTTSGERYHKDKFTAAHKTLPFGTVVKVTNLNNGKSVEVTINDRGPFGKGLMIDLSQAAAKEIGLYGKGIVPCKISYVLPKN
ncbi:septal ring lytic transglycosylase RlpA family protein [Pelobium sp.]|nr:septal ring lytic transglycosylase RlpA family protein [Pelobium sp.]MDA9554775.1 septal ring lytic transglycosylase RlpA family protein [Pelobium sp.]